MKHRRHKPEGSSASFGKHRFRSALPMASPGESRWAVPALVHTAYAATVHFASPTPCRMEFHCREIEGKLHSA